MAVNREVKFFSVNDVVYITHESFHPKKLVRTDDSTSSSGYSFSLSDFDILIDPIMEEYANRNVFKVRAGTYNRGDTVIVDELALTDGQKRNNAELLFTSESSWRGLGGQMLMLKQATKMMKCYGWLFPNSSDSSATLTQVPKPDTIYQDENGGLGLSSPWIFVYGTVSVESSGKWSGRMVIDLWKPDMPLNEQGEPEEPEQLAVIEVSNAASNRSITRDITAVGSRIRIRCEAREKAQGVTVTTNSDMKIIYRNYDNDSGCFMTLSCAYDIPVYLRIKDVVAPSESANGYAYCEAIHPFEGGFTSSSFAEGAWCGVRYGYPRTCGVFQERMVFGGNKVKPCTLWCSKIGDWSNFIVGTLSTSPIFATANTDNIDTIQWIVIAKAYIMFGSMSGEWYFGSSDGSAVKPSNYSFQRLSNFGSTKGCGAVMFADSVLVAKNGGKQVVDVSYNTLSEEGKGTELSLYASHLFEDYSISDMVGTQSPGNLLWVLRADGVLLSFTYEGNNNVFAWARHTMLDGVRSITAFRRGERDLLAMIVKDGASEMLAEFDPYLWEKYDSDGDESVKENIFRDQCSDGSYAEYESRLIPTPIAAPDGQVYGRKVVFKAVDLYLKTHNGEFDGDVVADGTEFTVKVGEGGTERVCDNGWLATNVRCAFGENRVELPLLSGWENEALCDIRTTYPAPLTITAIGADFAYGG